MTTEFIMEIIYKEFIFLVLLVALGITVLQANRVERIVRIVTLQTMLLITILEVADTADLFMAQLPYSPWERTLTSVIGYVGRPLIAWAVTCTLLERQPRTRYLYLIPAVINAVVYSLAFWTDWVFTFNGNVWNPGSCIVLTRFVVITAAVYVVIILILLIKQFHRFRQTKTVAAFSIVVAVCASVLEMLGDHPHILYTSVIIILLMFYIYMYSLQMKNAMDATQIELREQKVALSMSQLKPHFIGNGMATIRRLIKKDPDKAVEAMDYFIDYLRMTIDNADESHMVFASEELKFVQDYLFIEKLRFGEALQFEIQREYDDFLIPPFTIQPIVENAIRHGIRKQEDGSGTLKVTIQKTETEHCVTVQDDGIGFDVNATPNQDDGHAHIGTKNVRFRLENMCNGSMEVESEPGVGTCVRLHVPFQTTEGK